MKKLILIGVLALNSILSGDYLLEYKMDDGIQRFMYHNASKAKLLTLDDDSTAIYKIGKKTYIVTGKGKNKKIVDMDEMRAMAKAFGYDPSTYNQEEKFTPKIKKSSKRVTVGGIKGYEWTITGNYDGKTYKEKIIVTNDKRVVKSVRAMKNLFTAMSGVNADNNDLFEIEKGYVVIKADGIELKSFKEKSISASEYTLPTNATKQKMPKLDKKNQEELEKNLKKIEQQVKKEQAEEQQRAQKQEKVENKAPEIDTEKAINLLKSFF